MFIVQNHLALKCHKKTFFSSIVLNLGKPFRENIENTDFFAVIELIFAPFFTNEGCVLLGAISCVQVVWLCDFW